MILNPKRIYKWQKEAHTRGAAARGAALDPTTAAELRQLRAANQRKLEAQRGHYPVRLLCQLLQVPASGYYAWQQIQ